MVNEKLRLTTVADAQLFKKGGFKKFKSKMALIDSF